MTTAIFAFLSAILSGVIGFATGLAISHRSNKKLIQSINKESQRTHQKDEKDN